MCGLLSSPSNLNGRLLGNHAFSSRHPDRWWVARLLDHSIPARSCKNLQYTLDWNILMQEVRGRDLFGCLEKNRWQLATFSSLISSTCSPSGEPEMLQPIEMWRCLERCVHLHDAKPKLFLKLWKLKRIGSTYTEKNSNNLCRWEPFFKLEIGNFFISPSPKKWLLEAKKNGALFVDFSPFPMAYLQVPTDPFRGYMGDLLPGLPRNFIELATRVMTGLPVHPAIIQPMDIDYVACKCSWMKKALKYGCFFLSSNVFFVLSFVCVFVWEWVV